MSRIGIVGHEAAKFTPETEAEARRIIAELLASPDAVLVSGRCHLGGIDVWAEEEAERLDRTTMIYPPATHSWILGYKPRNLKIAQDSDEVHSIVVAEYPPSYTGMRFDFCYHCGTSAHIKSGGCWTAKQAQRLGKPAFWHVVGAHRHRGTHPNG
jgi:predicted Rossmann fold nucleotide-binding protein DprA/Smf involved in DNA uptake